MAEANGMGEAHGTTLVNGKSFDWRVDVRPVFGPLRCRRLIVFSGSQVPHMACTYLSVSGTPEVTDERIGAIIQYALLIGWEEMTYADLSTQADPNVHLIGYLKNLRARERKQQAALIDPFESERYDYYIFPTQIGDFFTSKITRMKHRHRNCGCKYCKYKIHNRRCPECGDLYFTSNGWVCANGHNSREIRAS